jgi:hypothetical protein
MNIKLSIGFSSGIKSANVIEVDNQYYATFINEEGPSYTVSSRETGELHLPEWATPHISAFQQFDSLLKNLVRLDETRD